MSWEVLTMKSRISFFNWGISKNLLRRCWPLWTSYLALLVLLIPANIAERMSRGVDVTVTNLNRPVLEGGLTVVYLSIFVGCLAALTMFSFLYNNRGSGMMSSLPLRRETLFGTVYLTGLVPLLLSNGIAIGLTMLLTAGSGLVRMLAFAQSFALMCLGTTAFYSFAVFCAVLTGSALVMPAVYLVLNLAVWAAEACVRAALSFFVYGLESNGASLTVLSPMVKVLEKTSISRDVASFYYTIEGMGYLIGFCLVSLLMVGLALLIFRRRHMESATDVVAVKILKPVFKYCMCFGAAFVFGSVVYDQLFRNMRGLAAALAMLALLLVGAAIGYFAAEMLLKKTVRVFKGCHKGLFVSCCVLLLFVGAYEFDLFGVERRIPEADEVSFVSIYPGEAQLSDKENVEAARLLHQQILDTKKLNESFVGNTMYVSIDYTLKNGKTLERAYQLPADEIYANDKDSAAYQTFRLVNCQEAIDKRSKMEIPLSTSTVSLFTIWWELPDGQYGTRSYSKELTAQEAVEFYEQCLLPDLQDGAMGRRWILNNEEYYATSTGVRFDLELSNRRLLPEAYDPNELQHEYFNFSLNMDAWRCLQWLQDNHPDAEIYTVGQLQVREVAYGEVITVETREMAAAVQIG